MCVGVSVCNVWSVHKSYTCMYANARLYLDFMHTHIHTNTTHNTRTHTHTHIHTLIHNTHTHTHTHTQHTHTQALHEKACEAGISMVNEVGLDPGIDHMLAVQCFDEVQRKGGKVRRRGRWEGGGAVEGDKGILCTLHYTSCAPPLPHQNTTSL